MTTHPAHGGPAPAPSPQEYLDRSIRIPGAPRLVHIGLLLAADDRDAALHQALDDARARLHQALSGGFAQFQWELTIVSRRRFSPLGALDPLALLEFGVREKIAQRWDYALVIVPNELHFRDRPPTWGVPSSALEVAVVSTETSAPERLGDDVAAMALHLLGHLWGLDHDDEGPMSPAPRPQDLSRATFPPTQRDAIVDRLDEVADVRIEEEAPMRHAAHFYWRTFTADPRGILTDIWGYSPWKLPFRLGRLTAGAVTFVVILLLTAETWEVGVSISATAIAVGALGAIAATTLFLFVGQNLAKMSGPGRWHEQLVRTQIVILGSLLVGMTALWVVLSVAALLASLAMPDVVLARWLGQPPDLLTLSRHSAFMAVMGLFGGALGGNLEDEGNFKAKFLFDQES